MSNWRETKQYRLITSGPVNAIPEKPNTYDPPYIWQQSTGGWCIQVGHSGPGAVICPIHEDFVGKYLPDKE